MTYAYNPSTCEAEARRLGVWGWPGLYSETCLKKKKLDFISLWSVYFFREVLSGVKYYSEISHGAVPLQFPEYCLML